MSQRIQLESDRSYEGSTLLYLLIHSLLEWNAQQKQSTWLTMYTINAERGCVTGACCVGSQLFNKAAMIKLTAYGGTSTTRDLATSD